MQCKQCKRKIKGEGRKVGLSTIHEDCFDDFITYHVKKVQKKNQKKRETDKKSLQQFKKESEKSKAKKTAWKWFSRWVRLRDAGKNGKVQCISCVFAYQWDSGKIHAGHFIPKSAGEYFYFHEDDVHGQCNQCNTFGSQDTGATYRVNLVKKIGIVKVEELEKAKAQRITLKRSTEDYRKLAKKYRLLVKTLQGNQSVIQCK